jgi:hypothetical protein
MKTQLIAAAVLIAASTALTAPAFAGGYGPAPFYRPSVGAPASQRGQSAQTLAAEAKQFNDNSTAYGGVRNGNSQAGTRLSAPTSAASGRDSLYSHH